MQGGVHGGGQRLVVLGKLGGEVSQWGNVGHLKRERKGWEGGLGLNRQKFKNMFHTLSICMVNKNRSQREMRVQKEIN